MREAGPIYESSLEAKGIWVPKNRRLIIRLDKRIAIPLAP